MSRIIEALTPFSREGIPAFKSLGQTADVGTEALEIAKPTVALLGDFTSDARSLSSNLAKLLTSLRDRDDVKSLMDLIYYVALSTNGYDQFGHYLRTTLLAGCNSLATVVNPPCTANFIKGANAANASRKAPKPRTALEKILAGEDPAKVLRGYERQQRTEQRRDARRSRSPPPTLSRSRPSSSRRPRTRTKPSSTTSWGPAVTRRRGATAIASNPVLVGVATTLVIVVAVFLAYNANAGLPLGADLQAHRRGAARKQPREGQRGADRWPARGRRGQDHSGCGQERDCDGAARPQARDEDQRASARLDDHHPAALRPRPQVRGGARRDLLDRASTRAPRSRSRTPPPSPSTSTSSSTCSTSARAWANSRTCAASADAFAGRGTDLNQALQTFVPLVANAVPVLTNIAAPETNFRRFFASQARAAIIVAPVAVQQGELWANLDLTLAAFADVARPFLQDTISKGPSGLETAIDTFPKLRPFFKATGEFFATLQPGARALNSSAPTLARGFELGVKGLKGSPGFNRRLTTFLEDFQRLRSGPDRPDRLQGPDLHRERAQPAGQLHHPGADGLQLHGAVLPQRIEPAERRRQHRHLAALHGDHDAGRARRRACAER